MNYLDDDSDYYLDCGCWSGQADHRCGPIFDRCRGCGVPDDCMCHESCDGPGNRCYICEADAQVSRDEDHAEALLMLDTAPALLPGWQMIPGDPMYPITVEALPWWWDRPDSWEYQQYAAGKPVRCW